jgi:hypothetical protein
MDPISYSEHVLRLCLTLSEENEAKLEYLGIGGQGAAYQVKLPLTLLRKFINGMKRHFGSDVSPQAVKDAWRYAGRVVFKDYHRLPSKVADEIAERAQQQAHKLGTRCE